MKKYYRQMDLAERYGCSPAYISTLVRRGKLPKPMQWHGNKVWPAELIEGLDRKLNEQYFEEIGDRWKNLADV